MTDLLENVAQASSPAGKMPNAANFSKRQNDRRQNHSKTMTEK